MTQRGWAIGSAAYGDGGGGAQWVSPGAQPTSPDVVSLIRFTPSFLRLGAWNVIMFVTYEQLKRALMKVQMLRESPF